LFTLITQHWNNLQHCHFFLALCRLKLILILFLLFPAMNCISRYPSISFTELDEFHLAYRLSDPKYAKNDNNHEFIAFIKLYVRLLSLFLTLSRCTSRFDRVGILHASRVLPEDNCKNLERYRWTRHPPTLSSKVLQPHRDLSHNRRFVQRSRDPPIFSQTDDFTTGVFPRDDEAALIPTLIP